MTDGAFSFKRCKFPIKVLYLSFIKRNCHCFIVAHSARGENMMSTYMAERLWKSVDYLACMLLPAT